MSEIAYRWMNTPAELFRSAIYVKIQPISPVAIESIPFTSQKRMLSGTGYQYQCALSNTSMAIDIAPVHEAYPQIDISGDKRAGIIIFEGNRVIASYIVPGDSTMAERRIFVSEDYRGKGLATRMIEQFMQEIPGIIIPKQRVNLVAVRAFLSGHKNVVNWAIAHGMQVPQKVRDAITNGGEAAMILAKAERAEEQRV